MNRVAAKLNLKTTNFNNAHGLSDKANHSTAYELGRLCVHCLKNSKLFADLVNTKVHNAVTYLDINKAAVLLKSTKADLAPHI